MIECEFGSTTAWEIVFISRTCCSSTNEGYEVSVHYEENKDLVWRAAGIPFVPIEGCPYHHWSYPADFNRPQPARDWSGNKIASNLNHQPLLFLREVDSLWEDLCSVHLEHLPPHISSADINDARNFLRDLTRPIILLHTSGTNFPSSKNIPDNVVAELYRILLDRCHGSLVALDWDFRVPTLAHGRFRHAKRDWGASQSQPTRSADAGGLLVDRCGLGALPFCCTHGISPRLAFFTSTIRPVLRFLARRTSTWSVETVAKVSTLPAGPDGTLWSTDASCQPRRRSPCMHYG